VVCNSGPATSGQVVLALPQIVNNRPHNDLQLDFGDISGVILQKAIDKSKLSEPIGLQGCYK